MLILSSTSGRLGNQLILHAHVLAFALEYGVSAYFPRLHTMAEFFEGPRMGLVIGENFLRPFHRVLPQEAAAWFCLRFGNFVAKKKIDNRFFSSVSASFDLPPVDLLMEDPLFIEKALSRRLVFLLGFRFRAYDTLNKQAGRIRDYFTPLSSIQALVSAVVSKARSQGDVLVGVHIRQGDYANFFNGRFFLSLEEYAERMRQIEKFFLPRKVAFLVASEDTLDRQPFRGLSLSVGPGSAVGDMYALSKCDYIFGVHSTFSRWASFIGEVPHWEMNEKSEPVGRDNFRVDPSPLGGPPPHLL